jgi:hypothetical protein
VHSGQMVVVTDCYGKLLKRRVVEVIGNVVLICKDEEYQLAKEQRSLPWCVGFKKEYWQSEAPPCFCKRVCKMMKTKDPGRQKRAKKCKESTTYSKQRSSKLT